MAYSKEQVKEIFDEICRRIEEGESLRSVLMDKDMPSRQTFYNWIEGNKEFIDQYARATTMRADNIFDEIIEIADESENDITEIEIIEGVNAEKVNYENIQRSKLRIDARKWVLSKMNPKKYGDKSELDLTSKGEKLNTTTTVKFVNARKESEKKK